MLSSSNKFQLLKAAEDTVAKAYAPFSSFRVGAAVLTEAGNIFVGCNVENRSYGLTSCAERNAIAAAVASEGGENMKIRAIAAVSQGQVSCSPCGACRQCIDEFSGSETLVLFYAEGKIQERSIAQLLPDRFKLSIESQEMGSRGAEVQGRYGARGKIE
ncbi:MAG: cytidine deaminase [Cyanobacteriota bacterium]|nr:cytidine deaminase [Cyanobacteriota bacterium]